ncbi:MAG: DUF2723 domain-containing protein [Bacteroidales bacterium]|jgi:hypothetical protein|nr:DUF2723 domain-containing protein [Bacteroidales bacterium]MCI1784696.1 DUF2723 domain-containing protein [Bacteroidales bacterium]
MDKKKFNLWNRIIAGVVFAVSAFTYLSTIEPTASFWDCGEFIASSYKLEVGHPPGNPVFQLIARFFTMFGDNMHAAVMVNSMSALCSALTIFFLYLTIVFLVKRIVKHDKDGNYTLSESLVIYGSAAVGALAYCFSDTFWFSAVEGEVYGMSSLFTSMVFWAMTKWYEEADRKYANRWIILIAFLMGLSIGVHLLNLLTIPAIVFLYYYKRRENGHYTFWEYVWIFIVSCIVLALILFVVIPYLPKIAAYVDLFFVNVLGFHYNVGAAFFLIALIAACFWGLFRTLKTEKAFLNTTLLCFTMIVIGFSIFSIEIIRSSVKTPTNEYQPDNPFTLVRYLSREQYGSHPIVYGQYFGAPYDLVTKKYWTPVDGKYKHVDGPADAKYRSSGKMLFPRMWASSDPRYVDFYKSYMKGKGITVEGADDKKPTVGQNLAFFFDYQLNWMYWRYFMWNFAGRQNDIHSPSPGDMFHGNWESGIKFLDNLRLGDQSNAPASLKNNKGKNHYFLLPLLLGILGLVFQFDKDKRGCWLIFLLFFMTGIAIVLYLNQPPYQVRERDYAYAGSFYAFAMWIGLAVAAVYTWIKDALKGKYQIATAAVVTVACLCVPALMAEENWDDHDRSNRYTSVEMARNYLDSVGPDGILVTHGDNDTFPLWYTQEVEGFRTDVRICNTSLLGTDWYIDQMKYACNKSAPLPITVGLEQYLYGTNEYVIINDIENKPVRLSDVMYVFKSPQAMVTLTSGKKVNFIMARKLIIPVNKANVIKYGILDAKFADQIPDQIEIDIPKDKDYISKPELFMLDLLSNYKWDRPLNLLNQGGDLNIGIKDYLMYDGYSYKFVPIKNKITVDDPGITDPDELYRLMTKNFHWDALKRTDYCVDYQNMYTHVGVMPVRGLFVNFAQSFIDHNQPGRAIEALDKCQEVMLDQDYPYETIPLGFTTNDYYVLDIISDYYKLGQKEKARKLAVDFGNELLNGASFYLGFYSYAKDEFQTTTTYIYMLADVLKTNGDSDLGDNIQNSLLSIFKTMTGETPSSGADAADSTAGK